MDEKVRWCLSGDKSEVAVYDLLKALIAASCSFFNDAHWLLSESSHP
jgi:hypothetical protein